jgi:uncharacterized membrane protein
VYDKKRLISKERNLTLLKDFLAGIQPMKIRLNIALLAINILTIILVLVISFFPNVVIRVVLGLPLVLFFPGFVLLAALFYRKNSMDTIARTALSFVLSIAVVLIIGLILNYTAWGITIHSVLISLAVFIVLVSLFAWFRQRKLPDEEILAADFDFNSWGKQKLRSRVISVILIAVTLVTISILANTIATPKRGEPYTEFYILGLDGKAVDYPSDIKMGDTGSVILGIINHEQKVTDYSVEIKIAGTINGDFGPITLKPEEKSENEVSFTPQAVGDHQEVEYILYKDEQSEPYLNVHLWINVK